MAEATGMRAAAKRTAFGEVTNTANVVRSTKDDSVVSIKVVDENLEKDAQVQQNKRSAPLLRPAQRPLSVSSSLKGLLSSVTNTTIDKAALEPTVDNTNIPQPSNSRKVITKQKTTVFKDPALPSVPEGLLDPLKESRVNSIIAPVHQTLAPRILLLEPARVTVSTQYDSTIPEVQTSDELALESRKPAKATAIVERSSVARSDCVFIDNNGNIQIYQDITSPEEEAVVSIVPAESKTNVSTRPALLDLPQQDKVESHDILSDPSVPQHETAQPSEPEEYWDDEEDENYDEEGYVTARSYRSVGGNTTGGATTVLFPMMNQKIKREIAAAKLLVEGSRTTEEIEDDCWDTSMVAEYGDEIFQYMRDLEVRLAHL